MQACMRNEMYLGKVPVTSGEPVAPPQGPAVHDTGMAHWPLSRTLSLLGVAILVHLIVMTSLAERGQC